MAVLTSEQLRQLRLADEKHRRCLARFIDSCTDARCDYELGSLAFQAELDLAELLAKHGLPDADAIYQSVDDAVEAAPF